MSLKLFVLVLCLQFFLTGLTSAEDVAKKSKLTVLGWIEESTLSPGEFKLHAKLDTGADTSSLHAEDMEIFKKKKEDWVRFNVTNRYGETSKFEQKVRRFAEIKSKGGSSQKRAVVKLGICVGGFHEIVEFSLVDRSNFSSAVLIGRNFLSGKILVDSSESYTSDPNCG